MKEVSDEFMNAMRKHLALVEALGEEHPDTMRAMMLAMELAPDWLREEMSEKAKELELLPEKVTGYLEDGTPMYSLEDIAKQLGMSIEEAQEAVERMLADRKALGLPCGGVMLAGDERIHKRQ